MKKTQINFFNVVFCMATVLIFGVYINAQTKDKLVKKLSDGREFYQRKEEMPLRDKSNEQNNERISLKVQAVLRDSKAEEEVLWVKEITFNKDERAFNRLSISDIYIKGNEIYLLYFEYLDLRVAKMVKVSNGWREEKDAFLERTNESIYPIVESKFINNKPNVTAKKYVDGIRYKVYEWKLKKGKWILTKEKTIIENQNWMKSKAT